MQFVFDQLVISDKDDNRHVFSEVFALSVYVILLHFAMQLMVVCMYILSTHEYEISTCYFLFERIVCSH